MYEVQRPVYDRTGETTYTPDGEIAWNTVRFITVGTARDMEEAKRLYPLGYWAKCYSWVLSPIKQIH
jgi:hypothetical protein